MPPWQHKAVFQLPAQHLLTQVARLTGRKIDPIIPNGTNQIERDEENKPSCFLSFLFLQSASKFHSLASTQIFPIPINMASLENVGNTLR